MEKTTTNVMAKQGILTREQLMKELNISDDLLRQWENEGLPALQPGSKHTFYHGPSVAEWLIAHPKKSKE